MVSPTSPSRNQTTRSTKISQAKGKANKKFVQDAKFLQEASHLSHETEEKKESIINEALHCIFLQLPQSLLELDQFLQELVQLEHNYSKQSQSPIPDKYSNILNKPSDTLLSVMRDKLNDRNKDNDKQNNDSKGKKPNKFDTKNKRINLLESMCAQHLDYKGPAITTEKTKQNKDSKKNKDEDEDDNSVALKEHVCFSSYSFPEVLNLLACDSTVPTNEEITVFFDKLRSLFIQLSKNFLKINLGLLLMFPKTEDNEDCNLSITVLNKLLSLTSLELIDMQIFRTYVEGRAAKIKFACSYPHFGEAQRILYQYDWDVVFMSTLLIRGLITQCAILYDSLIKNFDAIIKVKEQCNKGRRDQNNNQNDSPNTDRQSPINADIYS